ncbi:alpha/beta hydrolase [Gammaproteobacteria bacterium]|nr:alpha/beta hydrolase [Gammaproteobacteria bacterium]
MHRRVGSGSPLMLVHGYLGGQFMWQFQEPLQDDFELIMPSLAGYGESAHLEAPSSIPGNVDDICRLLDYLEIDKVDLLGHSMGGMIVQEMAANRPERINRLICLGTGSMGVLPNRFEPIEESRRKILNLGLEHARENIARTWFLNPDFEAGLSLCQSEGAKATKQAALASLEAWEHWDGREQLSQIMAPTLVIWAREDRSYDWSQQQHFLDRIPDVRIEIVEGCAHNVHMEKPVVVNDLIRSFLTQRF